MTSNRRVTEALLTASVLGIVLGAVLLSYFTFYRPHRAEALIESWTGHSWVQEVPGWRQNIKPLGIIETTGWMSHYNNAVGSWNGDINDDPFWWAQSWEYGHVHVLETGSFEEAYLDSVMWDLGYEHFYSCTAADRGNTWGSVSPYHGEPDAEHPDHYSHHKVCIWPGRISNFNNWQGANFRYLTILHELGHVLSLGDDKDGDACLMADGGAMWLTCYWEADAVRSHYNRW